MGHSEIIPIPKYCKHRSIVTKDVGGDVIYLQLACWLLSFSFLIGGFWCNVVRVNSDYVLISQAFIC